MGRRCEVSTATVAPAKLATRSLNTQPLLPTAAISCHNRVFIPSVERFPPHGQPGYLINSTIVLADGDTCPRCASIGQNVMVRGVGRGKHPSTVLRTESRTPLLQIGDWNWRTSDGADVTVQDLAIEALTVGVLVVATSSVTLRRVDVRVSEWGDQGPPEIMMPAEDHAALVVSDVYWLWIDSCGFTGATPPGYSGEHNTSKRPSVIFRGEPNPSCHGAPGVQCASIVRQVYAVKVSDSVFSFGGIQAR